MAIYPNIPEVRAFIKNGVTTVYRDGKVIKTLPTAKSQIRPARESFVYDPREVPPTVITRGGGHEERQLDPKYEAAEYWKRLNGGK